MRRPRTVLLLLLPWLLGAGTDLQLLAHRSPALGKGPEVVAWLEAQLARANAVFAGAGIRLHLEHRPDDAHPLEVRTREERHALAARAPLDGDLHLFLVKRLANIDAAGDICGVHWRYRGGAPSLRGRHYLILSLPDALSDTMAHELGHYFGLGHRRELDNLMTSPGRGPKSGLLPAQIRRVQAVLRAALEHQSV
jgi:hypothetical protein